MASGYPVGSQLTQGFVERLEEAVVLRPGAERDAQVAGTAQVLAGADDHAALAEALHDGSLVVVAEVDPGEVGLTVAGRQAAVVQLRLHVDALDHRPLHAAGDVVPVLE